MDAYSCLSHVSVVSLVSLSRVLSSVISPHLPLSPLYADSGCPLTQRIVLLSCTEGNWHKHTPAANNAALILLKDAAAAWIAHTSAI